MSSRVRQDEPPGRSRQRQIANLNETASLIRWLNFRLTFLSFVYFGKRPKNFCRPCPKVSPKASQASCGEAPQTPHPSQVPGGKGAEVALAAPRWKFRLTAPTQKARRRGQTATASALALRREPAAPTLHGARRPRFRGSSGASSPTWHDRRLPAQQAAERQRSQRATRKYDAASGKSLQVSCACALLSAHLSRFPPNEKCAEVHS